MDDLSFDDLVPAPPAAAEGEQSEDLNFDDLLPKPGLMQRAAIRGAREAILGAEQTGAVVGNGFDFKSAREVDSEDEAKLDPELDALLKKKIGEGYTDPDWWIAKLTHGATASSPMMGGALLGSVVGGGAAGPVGALAGAATGGGIGAFVQTLGPSYVAARKEGLDHGAAVDRSIKETMVSTAFGAAQGALPAVSFFGKAEGVLKKPISEALAQIFGAQPAAGITQHVVTNKVTGQASPSWEDLLEDYVLNAGTGAAMTAGHQGYNVARGKPAAKPKLEEAPPAGPDAAQEAALKGTPVDPDAYRKRIAELRAAKNKPADEQAPVEPPIEADAVEAQAPPQSGIQIIEAGSLSPEMQAVMDRLNNGTPEELAPAASGAVESSTGPVPPEVSAAVERKGGSDAGQTVPESEATLKLQQDKLLAGEVPAIMYPADADGNVKHRKVPKGYQSVRAYDADGKLKGVFHYNSDPERGPATTAGKIKALAKEGKENEVLGLGDTSKNEAIAKAQDNNEPVKAVTERTEDGTEVKAAAAAESDAPRIAAQLEENASPGNTVQVEAPEQVITQRQEASVPTRSLSDVRAALPKDASGSPDYQALNAAIKGVTGADKAWGQLTGAEQTKVLESLKAQPEAAAPAAPAPEVPAAPSGAGPKAVEVINRTKRGKKPKIPAPEASPPAETPVAGFRTAKGSTYEVAEDGTTARNKAARDDIGHEGDEGPKPATQKTVYLSPEEAQRLAPPQGPWRMVDHGDGTVSLATPNAEGRWGIAPSQRNVPVTTKPEVGRVPLELWKQETGQGATTYGQAHFGNEIVEVTPKPATPSRAALRDQTITAGFSPRVAPRPAARAAEAARPTTPEAPKAPEAPKVEEPPKPEPPRYETGKPMTANVLHGTTAPFETMDRAKLGSSTGAASATEAFFFADKPSTTNTYTGFPDQLVKPTIDEVIARAQAVKDGKRPNPDANVETRYQALSDEQRARYDALEKVVAKVANPKVAAKKLIDLLDSFDELRHHRALGEGRGETGDFGRNGETPRTVLANIKLQNPMVVDFKGERSRPESYAKLVADAKAAGHDGLIIENTYDGGPRDTIYAVFDEKNIGDRFKPETPKAAAPAKVETAKAVAKARTEPTTPPKAKGPVTNDSKPGRILRPVEEETASQQEQANEDRGFRGKDHASEAPTFENNGRKRFLRRARKQIKALGDKTPEHYADAAKADEERKKLGKGVSTDKTALTKRIDEMWQREFDLKKEGVPLAAVTGEAKGEVAKVEEKTAAEAKAMEDAATAGEDEGPIYKAKTEVSDEDVERVIAKMPPGARKKMREINDPEKQRELVALMLDQVRSEKSRGVFDGEQSKSNFELEEGNVTAGENGLGELPPTPSNKTAMRENAVIPEADELKTRAEVQLKGGGTKQMERAAATGDARRVSPEVEAAIRAKYAQVDQAIAAAEAHKRTVREELGGQRSEMGDNHYEDMKAIIEATASPKEMENVSKTLNSMSEVQFKDWLADTIATDKDAWLKAIVANEASPIKHMEPKAFRRMVREIGNEPVRSERTITLKKALQEAREQAGPSGSKLAEALHSFLFNRIIKLVGDIKVHILDDTAMNRVMLSGRAAGAYNGERNMIVLRSSEINGSHNSYRLVLHEALHGALATLINTDKVFKTRVDALRNHIDDVFFREAFAGEKAERQGLKSNEPLAEEFGYDHYGLKDAHEFISEAMTNPRFQELLSKIEITPQELRKLGLRDNSLLSKAVDGFSALVNLVSDTFGLPRHTRTALEQAIRLTNEGLTRRELKGSGARFSEATAGQRREWAQDETRTTTKDFLEAPIKNPEEAFTNELIDKGVDKAAAKEIAKALMAELGDKPTMKEARPLIKELAKEFGTPKAGAKGKAAIQKSKERAAQAAPEKPTVPTEPPKEGLLNRIRDRLPEEVKVFGKPLHPRDMLETFRTQIADHQRPVQRMAERMERALGRVLRDDENFYVGKRLLGGKTAEVLRKLQTGELREADKIVKDGAKANISYDDLGKGLVALVTEERATRMKAKGAEEGKGSGMTLEEAEKHIAMINADPAKKAVFDRLVDLNKRLRRMQHDVEIEAGNMSKEQSERLYASEENYTSLAGFEDELTTEAMKGDQTGRNGGSTSVRGSTSKEAKGRSSASNNPIENMFQNTVHIIERAERNKVSLMLEKVVKEGRPNDIQITKHEEFYDPRAVGFRSNGEQRYFKFETQADAEAFKRLSAPQGVAVVAALNKIQNAVKSAWTHYSPEFVLRHFAFRYPIEALMNLQGMKEQGVKTKPLAYMKEIWSTVPDVVRYMKGEKVLNAETAKLLAEMAENGGVVSYRSQSDSFNVNDRMKLISLEKKGTLNSLKEFHEAWDLRLGAMDTAERLAVYKRAKDADMTPQKAAMVAREATVDFERKGAAQAYTGLWLEFGNVAIQTTGRMGRAFAQSPSFRRTILGVLAAATAIEFMNYAIGEKDENGVPDIENIPGYVKGQNIVLLTGGKDAAGRPNYVKLPLPYPLFMIWPTGAAIAQATMKELGVGKMTYGDMGSRVFHGAMETLTPFGRNVVAPGDLLTPAILRPVQEIYANKNGLGIPVHTDFPKKGTPLSEQGKTNTAEGWKTMAQGLAKIGIDRYPEDVKLMVDHFVGAQRRLVAGAYETGKSLVSGKAEGGEPLSWKDVPGARVVMGEVDRDAAAQSRFYTVAKKAEVDSDTLKSLRSTAPSAEDKERIARAVGRTGMSAKQLVTINDMAGKMKKPNSTVKQSDEVERPAAVRARAVIFRQNLRKLDAMGVQGGMH